MSDEAWEPSGAEISRANAREFVRESSIETLRAWGHCGCDGCTYCNEVVANLIARFGTEKP